MGLALSLLCGLAHAATLRIGNGAEPESLDPHRAQSVSADNILRDLYEGLTSVAPDGAIVPGAARSWDMTPDGLSYVFHLRDAARWSDGSELVADDFVAGLQRSADPRTGSSFSQLLAPIANAQDVSAGRRPPAELGVDALDPHTLRIRLHAPAPYLLGVLAHPASFPLHRRSFERHGAGFTRAGNLVSNGAYRLAEWTLHSQVVLERNTHYWNDASTHLDRVVYLPTEDVNAELARYRAGELDITFQLPLVLAGWIREHLGAELHVAPYLGTYFLGFNVTRPPFQDNAKLRRALSMAIDRDVITQKVMLGLALPAYGWVPPGVSNHAEQRPEWADWPRDRRIAEARRLLAEAGYGPDRQLTVELRYNTHQDHKRIATVVAAMWKQHLGVRTTLVNEESRVFLANRRARRVTQVFRGSWVGDYDDASSFVDVLLSTHGKNDSGWSDPQFDARVHEAQSTADPAARRALLEQAERDMLDAAPIAPIYFYVSKHLVRAHVRGWRDNVLDYHYAKDLELAP